MVVFYLLSFRKQKITYSQNTKSILEITCMNLNFHKANIFDKIILALWIGLTIKMGTQHIEQCIRYRNYDTLLTL